MTDDKLSRLPATAPQQSCGKPSEEDEFAHFLNEECKFADGLTEHVCNTQVKQTIKRIAERYVATRKSIRLSAASCTFCKSSHPNEMVCRECHLKMTKELAETTALDALDVVEKELKGKENACGCGCFSDIEDMPEILKALARARSEVKKKYEEGRK